MSVDEARKILNVPPKASQQRIRAAFAQLQCTYVTQLQYAPHPREREVAVTALARLQDAYHVLVKAPAARPIKPPRSASTPASAKIPRVSLGGAAVQNHRPVRSTAPAAAAKRPSTSGKCATPRPAAPATTPTRSPSFHERTAAFFICAAIFALGLALLAGAWK